MVEANSILDRAFPALSEDDIAIEEGFNQFLGAGRTRNTGEFVLEHYMPDMLAFLEEESQ